MGELITTAAGAAYRAGPAEGGPGVLVLHAWWGLNDAFKDLCDRLAGEGFVALAPDLYGGGLATTVDEAQALLDGRDDEALYNRANAAIDALRADPAVRGGALGTIGFSMGAAWAIYFASARPADLGACVLFYGCGEADFSAARAAYLGHFAVDDPWESEEYVQAMEEAMRAAGREVTIHRYAGAGHWFFEPNQPAYEPQAAALAWERTLDFLRARL
jgi:carboxymethylenebutenolidase